MTITWWLLKVGFVIVDIIPGASKQGKQEIIMAP
jgi:hypothetical protein